MLNTITAIVMLYNWNYLWEFMVIQIIPRIKFKNKFIIDMRPCPDKYIDRKSKTKQNG